MRVWAVLECLGAVLKCLGSDLECLGGISNFMEAKSKDRFSLTPRPIDAKQDQFVKTY